MIITISAVKQSVVAVATSVVIVARYVLAVGTCCGSLLLPSLLLHYVALLLRIKILLGFGVCYHLLLGEHLVVLLLLSGVHLLLLKSNKLLLLLSRIL